MVQEGMHKFLITGVDPQIQSLRQPFQTLISKRSNLCCVFRHWQNICMSCCRNEVCLSNYVAALVIYN